MARPVARLVDPLAVVPGVGGVRASDEDRERVASEVREHFALGRLDTEELDRRLGLVYAAGTLDDLRALRADLPRLSASRPEPRAARLERALALDRVRRLIRKVGVALLPFTACSLVWLTTGAQGSFWPLWVGLLGVLRLLRKGRLTWPGIEAAGAPVPTRGEMARSRLLPRAEAQESSRRATHSP